MDFLTHVTEFLRQHQFHLRMHVFDAVFDHKLAALAYLVDISQFGQQLGELFLLQQSDTLEHGDMCHGTEHVVFSQIEVHLAVSSHGEAVNLLVHLIVFFPQFHCS